MARVVELQTDFSLGMKPDLAADALPRGAVLNLIDMIPNHRAPLAGRGAWVRVGATLGDDHVRAVAFAPFAAGGQLVGVTNAGSVKQIAYTGASVTARGSMTSWPYGAPVFYRENLYIPSNAGNVAIKVYNGTTNVADAGGTVPQAMFAAVYKDHLVLARSNSNTNRIWFSNGGDATSWDTAADGQWLDASHLITGLATLRNMILVFGEEQVERVRGDIIPGVVGSDMVREPAFAVGTADPSSIAVTDDYCIFANGSGIYLTDGVGLVDLTAQGNIKQWWRSQMASYDANWIIAGGIFRGHYVASVCDSSGPTFKFTLVCDIASRTFFRFSNLCATAMCNAPAGLAGSFPGELFFGERLSSNVARISDCWEPQYFSVDDGSNQGGGDGDDGNGTHPSPQVRTGYFRGTPGLKRWKRLYTRYSLRDNANANPTVTVKVLSDVSGSSTYQESSTLAETAAGETKRLPIALTKARSEGIMIDVAGSNLNSELFRIYGFDAEVQALEQSRG